MSRTRAERRANTLKKTSRRKAMAIRGEIDQFPAHGYCGGKITPGGEARSCPRCIYEAQYEKSYIDAWKKAQLESFMISFEE